MSNRQYKSRIIVLVLLTAALPGTSVAVDVGQQAPEFSVQELRDGRPISLQQFEGKLVYLDFWASWCPPCLKSFPFMEKMHQKFSSRGLVIVAIGLDEKRADALAFVNQTQASFIIGHSNQGEIATRYGIQAMPSTYLIGRDGKIKLRHLGFNTGDEDKLEMMIESAL